MDRRNDMSRIGIGNICHAVDPSIPQTSQDEQLTLPILPPPPPPPPPAPPQSSSTAAAGQSPPYNIHTPSNYVSASPSTSTSFSTPAASPVSTPRTATHQAAGGVQHTIEHNTIEHIGNTSLYQCGHCQKRYSRPEHLQRHVSSHLLGKRFKCDVCRKGFGRADLLKRHRANHDNDHNPDKKRRINSAPGSSRVAHACKACAKARVKCEDSKPCNRCRQRNLVCEYASTAAGNAAAMHLLHLAKSQPNPDNTTSVATRPNNFGSESTPYQVTQPTMPLQGIPHHAAAGMTNAQYVQSTVSNPPVLGNGPSASHVEAAHQLPTPEAIADHNLRPILITMDQEGHPEDYQAPQYRQDSNTIVDIQGQPFTDLMQSVLYGQRAPNSSAAVPTGGVLDYYNDTNLDMNDVDFGMLDDWNVGNIHDMIATDPNLAAYVSHQQPDDPTELSRIRERVVSIWNESPWRWMPDEKRDNNNNAKSDLSLGDINDAQLRPDPVVSDRLSPSCRDRIMATIMQACNNNATMSRVASSFPSVEVMDSLSHVFLACHMWQVSEFIHLASFKLNDQPPQWLGSAAAAGAISIPVVALRKFGYALEEAVRVTLPMVFENNNSKIMDISLVQALIINQDISLWSGNRRRTEIVSCHLNVPIAMVRGRLNFSISEYPVVHVDATDDGAILENKWKEWSKRESWKRLSFHLFIRDAQTSITAMTNPHISFTEMTLPLPAAKELWFAKSAQEWKHHYLRLQAGEPGSQLSLGDVLRTPNLITNEEFRLDVQFSVCIVLYAFWSLIQDYHKLSTMSSSPVLINSHRDHLVKTVNEFQRIVMNSNPHIVSSLSAQEPLIFHLLQMNLFVSITEVQLFVGKEGDDQAKRAYPALQHWTQAPDSRKAVWHAGQILRHAKEFPVNHLKDFYAVAVHHAALTLWTWGIVTKALQRARGQQTMFNIAEAPVLIDGLGNPEQFFTYENGRPAITMQSTKETILTCFVDDPAACMRAVADIFHKKHPNKSAPPMVERLCHMIGQMGDAPRGMGLN